MSDEISGDIEWRVVQWDGPSASRSRSRSPKSRSRSGSRSDASNKSKPSNKSDNSSMSFRTAIKKLDPENYISPLLSLCDSVRASLASDSSLGVDSGRLTQTLEGLLSDEVHLTPTIQYDTIVRARLDKLLMDLLDPLNQPPVLAGNHFAAIKAAETLQKSWRARFKEKYFETNELRNRSLVVDGCLKDIEFASITDEGSVIWKARTVEPTQEIGVDPQFPVGHWWVNIACAHRDGMVGSTLERATKGKYGIDVLPLLAGTEDMVDCGSKYTRTSKSASDMYFGLLTQIGKQVRVLRGYRLKSIHAPVAGVRYDGLYNICMYSYVVDEETKLHQLEMTLERVDGQKSVEMLKRVPKPSQLDDWRFYEKMESEKIKQTLGDQAYMSWAINREAEQMERKRSRASQEFDHRDEPRKPSSGRRQSLVKLEIPERERRGSKIRDPREELTPASGVSDAGD